MNNPSEKSRTDFLKVNTADSEAARLSGVLPAERQVKHAEKPFYCFLHFGMNTATGREWGNATETVDDFTVTQIKPAQWVQAVKSSGATGVILTAKHHDGFCLWDTKTTDFNVMHTALGADVVAQVARECRAAGLDFGVYLSPWDMHEPTYATPQYNDFLCDQLTELLTGYGDIFEVWLDGAKGADAKDFTYDWERYYRLIRTLQPNANIAICGPDIRWIGNERGVARQTEYCVVPSYLTLAETVSKHSQQSENDQSFNKLTSKDEDLGSRAVLARQELCWYPAEADISIRKGWFYPGGGKVKSVKKLFSIYLNTVGKNAYMLLNVPPTSKGVIHRRDAARLKKLGRRISAVTARPVTVVKEDALRDAQGVTDIRFDATRTVRYCVLQENIRCGQRVERYDLYLQKPNGAYHKVFSGDIIGMRRIIPLKRRAIGARLVIREARAVPCLESIGFYE